MDNKVKLYNVLGEELKTPTMQIASRMEIALNIFKHHMNSDDQQQLLFSLADVASINEEGDMKISLDDENVQDVVIQYGSSQIINKTLDEDLHKAYFLLTKYTDPIRFKNVEKVILTEDLLKEVRNRHLLVPELIIAQDICDVQGEIYAILGRLSEKQVTSYQANLIQERFEDFTPYLTSEQIAAGYYNISIIHRALLAEKDIYDPQKNNSEKECLYKIIENTSDYKRVRYCVNRLGSGYKDRGAVRAAYRRALAQTEAPNELYKINSALAECYLDDYNPRIGFHSAENNFDTLLKAELYYSEALKYAQITEKPALLKKIAQIQLKQNRLDEWTETETYLAMEVLDGEERVHTLLKIATKNQKLQKDYLEFALKQTVSSEEISESKQRIIVSKINHHLRPIYIKENNKKGIIHLDKVLSKVKNSKNKANPLLKYIKKQKSK